MLIIVGVVLVATVFLLGVLIGDHWGHRERAAADRRTRRGGGGDAVVAEPPGW